MKQACNLIRDLMPRVVDGTASPESIRAVDEHVAACEECAGIYAKLQQNPPQEHEGQEWQAFFQAAKNLLRRKELRRKVRIVLTAALVLALIFAACYGVDAIDRVHRAKLDVPGHDFYLVRLRDDRVMLFFDANAYEENWMPFYAMHKEDVGSQWGRSTAGPYLYDSYRELPMAWWEVGTMIDGELWYDTEFLKGVDVNGEMRYDEAVYVDVIYQDGDTEHLIYQAGDDIPLCSRALESYLETWDELWSAETAEAKAALEKSFRRVPEFKTE